MEVKFIGRDSYLMQTEGECNRSHTILTPPDCGDGCCEHTRSLTLCAVVIPNYLQRVGKLSVWAWVILLNLKEMVLSLSVPSPG